LELGGEIVSYYDLNGVSLVFVHLSVKKVVVTHLTAKEIIGTYFETERLMVTHLVTKGLVVARGRERFFPRGYKGFFLQKWLFRTRTPALCAIVLDTKMFLWTHTPALRAVLLDTKIFLFGFALWRFTRSYSSEIWFLFTERSDI